MRVFFPAFCYLTAPRFREKTIPPPEVVKILLDHGIQASRIEKIPWLPYPQLIPNSGKLREVDAREIIGPILRMNDPRLAGSLRTMDIANGCGNQCDTCLADSQTPSSRFSLLSLEELFSDQVFLRMLQSDSLRIGSSGDIIDHPQAVDIIAMIIDKTQELDQNRQASFKDTSIGRNRYLIKVWTNYRPGKKETRLQGLIGLVRDNPDRLVLHISTPFNRDDSVNRQMIGFLEKNRGIFEWTTSSDGVPSVSDKTRLSGLRIEDVRGGRLSYFASGRVLSPELVGRRKLASSMEVLRIMCFEERGQGKPYLNAEGFWFFIYATFYESYTYRVFTPLGADPALHEALLDIHFHYDFPTPPNWPGKKSRHYWTAEEIIALRQEAYKNGMREKPNKVIC